MASRRPLLAVVGAWALAAPGCASESAYVEPAFGESEFPVSRPRVSAHVRLCLGDGFTGFSLEQFAPAESFTWLLGLGRGASRALSYALLGRFDKVTFERRLPEFPLKDPSVDLVIVPRIGRVQANGPGPTGPGEYRLSVEIVAEVRGGSGQLLKRVVVTGEGSRHATAETAWGDGVYGAAFAASRHAIHQIAERLIAKLEGLVP